MALRKYGKQYSKAAQSQRAAEPAPSEQLPLGTQPQPTPAPDTTSKADKSDELISNLRSQIDSMQQTAYLPGLSAKQRDFLKSNLHYLQHANLLVGAHHVSMARGIAPDSDEYFHHVRQMMDHYLQQIAPAAAPAEPTLAHVDIATEDHGGQPEDHMAHMVSAPVSRGTDHFAGALGDADLSANRITLSAGERESARAAGISDQVYAANKLKMLKMKKAGLLKE